jgi:exodeoxyribonuclease VII large subunit
VTDEMTEQMSLFAPPVWTVSALNRRARTVLDSDETLQDVWVAGEVSNLSRPASGHVYFTLKDSEASLRCVMWREIAARQILPREGQNAEVHGRISLYEAGGMYQLYADGLRPVGEGELYARFVALKAKLEAEGLFAAERKRALPPWPRRIAIVTSPSGAALQDVLNVLARRYPLAEAVLAPTSVQGEQAPAEIVGALARAIRARPDVILLVRGGGSLEDLWAFNDESVVRAVAASTVPIVAGVGHETDFTLVDFAADRRAPTPSAAAEVATPDRAELQGELSVLTVRLARATQAVIRERRSRLGELGAHLRAQSPRARLDSARQRADELERRLREAIRQANQRRAADVQQLVQLLRSVSPFAVLQRGYALVTRQDDGTVVRSPRQAPIGSQLQVRLAHGGLQARVEGHGQGEES